MKIANEMRLWKANISHGSHGPDPATLTDYALRIVGLTWSLHTIWAVMAEIHTLCYSQPLLFLHPLLSIRRRKGQGWLWLAGIPSTFAILHLGIGSWINHTLSFKENPLGSQKGHKNIQLFNGNEKGDVFLRNGKIFTYSNTISATNALLVYMYIPC